jgi:hypothetical protein
MVAAMSRLVIAAILFAVTLATAATSTRSVPSTFGGNGHNASFDGRLFLARSGPGWLAYVLRPEGTTYSGDGLPDATGPMWSESLTLIDGEPNGENALAICEPDATRAPFACNGANQPDANGGFACYDVFVFDSDATKSVAEGGQRFRRRHLLLRVADPGTPNARPVDFTWGGIEQLSSAAGELRGIEPTFTRDGKLMVWQGDMPGAGGVLLYSVNANPCGLGGWTAPRSIAHMFADPTINTIYRLATRQLRAADGTPFADNAPVFGAYPWLLPDGDGIVFSAALMPCRSENDPAGCGPRRNATSVLGYPTNWGIAHIDGGINPSTTDGVRLFFSSPGATTFSQLPVTAGHDVWPLFGTNTSNYVEVSFDDGLDGQYAGLWHLNESITPAGNLDVTKSPDVSGYFNTAEVHGAISFPAANNGILGKAAIASNGWLEVAHDASLLPTNGITMEMSLRLASDPDCDGGNNFRVLLRKGDSYSLILEEPRGVRARVRVAGGAIYDVYSGTAIGLDTWTKVTAEYDAPTGRLQIRFDDQIVAEQTFPPAQLEGTDDPLTIGGVGSGPACREGGNFDGTIDEVSISRIARHIQTPSSDAGPGGGEPGTDAGPGGGGGDPDPAAPGGCCDARGNAAGAWLVGLVLLALRKRRR